MYTQAGVKSSEPEIGSLTIPEITLMLLTLALALTLLILER
jgi:hypothetical protein